MNDGGGVDPEMAETSRYQESLPASLAHLKGRLCLIFSVYSPEGGRPCLQSLLPCPRIHIEDKCRNKDGSYIIWGYFAAWDFIIIYSVCRLTMVCVRALDSAGRSNNMAVYYWTYLLTSLEAARKGPAGGKFCFLCSFTVEEVPTGEELGGVLSLEEEIRDKNWDLS